MELCVSAKGNLFVKLEKDGEETVICLEPISKSFYDKQAIIESIKAKATEQSFIEALISDKAEKATEQSKKPM